MTDYCERHHRAYEIRRTAGGWTYECPKCRDEGRYDTFATSCVEMLPEEKWTVSNRTELFTRQRMPNGEEVKVMYEGSPMMLEIPQIHVYGGKK